MEQVTIYRTSQGFEFEDSREAQLVEDILTVLDKFFSVDAVPMPVVDALRALKKERKLSNRALAKQAGISPGMLSDVLNERVPLTDAMREKLEHVLLSR